MENEKEEPEKNYFKEIYENPSRNLNNVMRYSGLFCMKKETDGYHVIDMMSICLYIYEELKKDKLNLDIRDLIYRCYIHDLDEVLAGDIQRNIKYYNDSIYSAINDVIKELLHKNYSESLIKDIEDSKNPNCLNGLIVKIADTIQSSLKIYEEIKLNNFHFNKIIKEHLEFINNLKKIIDGSICKLSNDYSICKTLVLLSDIVDSFYSNIEREVNKLINNQLN